MFLPTQWRVWTASYWTSLEILQVAKLGPVGIWNFTKMQCLINYTVTMVCRLLKTLSQLCAIENAALDTINYNYKFYLVLRQCK
jgi:hypothetical protein